MSVEPLFDKRCEHGEGPVWDPVEKRLYWVDLLKGDYLKGDIRTGTVEQFNVGQPLGVLALREKGGLVLALRDGFALWDEATQTPEFIQRPGAENPATRFNDGAVDPAGRFFAGTMTFEGTTDIGNLYRLGTDHSLEKVESSLFVPNGMGWSPGKTRFYLTDTNRHVIYVYDYDMESGAISNRRPFIQFPPGEYPDGMTLDAEGNFWIALWGSARLCRYDANGKKIGEIPVPVQYPTSCCFGGDDLSTLFITSSRLPLSAGERERQPLAGSVLMIQTGVTGMPQSKFKG